MADDVFRPLFAELGDQVVLALRKMAEEMPVQHQAHGRMDRRPLIEKLNDERNLEVICQAFRFDEFTTGQRRLDAKLFMWARRGKQKHQVTRPMHAFVAAQTQVGLVHEMLDELAGKFEEEPAVSERIKTLQSRLVFSSDRVETNAALINEAWQQHNEESKQLAALRKANQGLCSHPQEHRESQFAMGHDGFTSCKLCGAAW